MKILTVMSGVILSATGAWCLAFYRSAFSSVAFVLALAMIQSAIFLISAYLVFGKNRLPETLLVEGMFTLLFGFVTLNNEVTDTAMSMFFGSWLAAAGLIRFSQSLTVSRFDTRNWAKILPLSILSAIFGFIMLMHSLVSSVNQLVLVGAALILNGLSQLVYALYMVRQDLLPKTQQARERMELKQAQAEARRQARDELRAMTRKERERRKKELRDEAAAYAENKKRLAKIERDKHRAAREALLDPTIQLSEEDVALIAAALEVEETPAPEPAPPQPPVFPQEAPLFSDLELSRDTLPKEPVWDAPAFAQKPDITRILEQEVKMPEPLPLSPLSLEDLLEEEDKKAKEEAARQKEAVDQRFTEEFSWNWPLKES